MNKRNILLFILVILMTIPAIRTLLFPGFFPMHDDTQPARVYEMAKSLSYGQFPVRWVPDLGYGYGYPLFNFYAPLPYYIGALFALSGIDILVSTKLMIGIGFFLAAFTMFLLGRYISRSDLGGIVASILYTYAPYHAVQVYVRGAIGELYAYAFLPLFGLGLMMLFKGKKEGKRWVNSHTILAVVLGSIALAGILLSHNVIGFVTLFFTLVLLFGFSLYTMMYRKSIQTLLMLMTIIFFGIGLSAFFTFPALFEKSFTKVEELTKGGSDFRQHFLFIDQLWDSPWGYGGSASGNQDGMSFKIGKTHLILGFISCAFFIFLYWKKRLQRFQMISFLSWIFLIVLSTFFMLDISSIFYRTIPGFPYIQYPWRFLVYTLFGISLLPTILFTHMRKHFQIVITILLSIIVLWVNAKYFSPKENLLISSQEYVNQDALHTRYSKISDEYMPKEFIRPGDTRSQDIALFSSNRIESHIVLADTPTLKKVQLEMSKPDMITTHVAYFPGWKIYIDGSLKSIINKDGRIVFDTPSGKHTITLQLANTSIQSGANAISLLTLFLLLYVSLFWKHIMVWLQKHL